MTSKSTEAVLPAEMYPPSTVCKTLMASSAEDPPGDFCQMIFPETSIRMIQKSPLPLLEVTSLLAEPDRPQTTNPPPVALEIDLPVVARSAQAFLPHDRSVAFDFYQQQIAGAVIACNVSVV